MITLIVQLAYFRSIQSYNYHTVITEGRKNINTVVEQIIKNVSKENYMFNYFCTKKIFVHFL